MTATLAKTRSAVAVPRARLVAGSLALGALAAALAPRFTAAGSPLDEGGLLAYGSLILHGAVPGRDVHSFYGPLSTYLPAGVFKVAGPTLAAERALGLAYRLLLAASLLVLVRRRGAPAIVAAGVLLLWLVPSQGVAAYATFGALACSAGALALADTRHPALAGAAAGLAVLMRFDWVLPIVLASLPYLVTWTWRQRRSAVAGALIAGGAYLPYLAFVGPAKLRLVAESLRTGQGARHLPLQLSPTGRGGLLDLALVAIGVLAVAGWRRRHDDEGIAFLAAALLGVGLLPYALVREDHAHVVICAIVPVVMLAAAVPAMSEDLGVRLPQRLAWGAAGVAIAYTVALALVAGDGQAIVSLSGVSPSLAASHSFVVTNGARSFRVADAATARTAQRAVERVQALAPHGGMLFVGPADLRRTNYNDAYLYYLLPRFRPATFYITLDPKSTQLPGQHLADQLPRADVLVLNAAYDEHGSRAKADADISTAAARVVARSFCLRGSYGGFRVYTRCRASAAGGVRSPSA